MKKTSTPRNKKFWISLLLGLTAPVFGFSQAQTFTFTNCSATGRLGPTQTQVTTAYAATNLSLTATTNATSGIQTWTVPLSGNYRIEAWGAKGGDGAGQLGGAGAKVQGDFTLTAGSVLKILVGQMGGSRANSGSNSAGAGGGGSFVTYTNNVPLVVAGGGGGAGSSQAGLVGGIGLNGSNSAGSSGLGGINGGGGGGGLSGTAGTSLTPGGTGSSCSYGAGGGGFYTRGGYNCSGAAPLISGESYTAGGFGGFADVPLGGVEGGFGCGAGVGHRASAGGGWSGGGGDGGTSGGGGGGSFNAGANQTLVAGFNSSHGRVFITSLCNISLSVTGTDANGAICTGNSVTLTTNGVSNYSWSTGSSASSIVDSPTITTTYTLSATSTQSCTAGAAITVTVNTAIPSLTVANTASLASGVCPGNTVNISASGATNYSWSPVITNGVPFSPVGTNTYVVTGYNACGTSTAATSVSVHPLPSVSVSVSQASVCSGNTIVLIASGAQSYVLSSGFPSGTPFFPSITTVYTATGTSVLGCTATANVGNTVVATPVLAPVASPTVICLGNSGTVSVSGATNYTWLPVNTFTGSNTGTIVITPTSTATYTLIKANSNCFDTKTITVFVNSPPPVFAIASPTIVCAGSNATLSGGGANTYSWIPSTFNLVGANVVVSPTANTIYTVTGSDGTCTATYTVPLATNPIPTITAVSTSSSICAGQSVTLTANGALSYTWSPMVPALTGSVIVLAPGSPTNFIVTGENSFSCTSQASQIVIVNLNPNVNAITNRTLVCVGGPSTLTANGANTYVWSNGALTNTTVVNPLVTTIYTVTGTFTSTGCSGTKTIQITAYTPVTAINGPTAVCVGSSITISSAPATSYLWSLNGATLSTSPNILISPSVGSTYSLSTVSVSNNVSCPGYNTVFITVDPLPIITASTTRSVICRNYEFATLNAGGGLSYNWLFVGAGQSVTVAPTVLSTTYTVIGTDVNGCSDSATVVVRTSACVGLEDMGAGSSVVSIYPNPSDGEFYIESQEGMDVKVVNELGQELRNIRLNQGNKYKVTLKDLPSGVYFLIGNGEKHRINEKVIIQK